MKVTFLTQSAHKLGGTERSAITQANTLVAAGHDVRILSVVKAADQPALWIDERVTVEFLVDLTTSYDEELHARPSLLVPERWDKQFSALPDIGLEAGLRGLSTDVLVTVTPALLASAVALATRARPAAARAWSSSSGTCRSTSPPASTTASASACPAAATPASTEAPTATSTWSCVSARTSASCATAATS